MDLPISCQKEVLWPLIEQYLSPEIRSKLAHDIPLTHSEHETFLKAEKAFCAVSNALARFPQTGTLTTNESIGKLLSDQEDRIKRHVSRRTSIPKKLFDYFADNVELSDVIKPDDEPDLNVTGVKLQMREIACTLIDEFDAVPVRAADAVYDHFKDTEGAYEKKLSFRTTVYNHYEITRGCKPEKKSNSKADVLELKRIISGLI